MVGADIRKLKFVEWYSRYGTPAKMGLYFNALEDPNAVLDYRAVHPARPEFHQDVDRSLFPARGHSIYEITELPKLKLLFENSNQVKTADDGSIKSGIGNYVMWLRLLDPETWKDEPFWDGDCVAAGTPTGRTRMATLLKNGFDYLKELEYRKTTYKMDKYLAAIRTKPFVLLAGISGTGKSRLVRQLARGCCPANSPLKDEQKPGNFEIIPVKPNWHDSTELLGYVTRITEDNKPKYVLTPFVKFLAKAWMNPDVPFFLCLDEMNLASVEQYFAEYLSAIESRKWVDASDPTKGIKTDVVVKFGAEKSNGTVDPFVEETVKRLLPDYETAEDGTPVKMLGDALCEAGGIRIPSNLVVMGTVNMDETTCSFSRKVLDRAMTFELNDVADMYDPAKLAAETECEFGTIPATEAEAKLLTGKEAYDSAPGQSVAITTNGTKVGDAILKILEVLNEKEAPAKKDDGSDDGGTMSLLAKTPFKIAYRTRNEIMIYCVERIGKGVVTLPQALDEAISMKILSRIEGDSQYVQKKWLVTLSAAIESELSKLDGYDTTKCTLCKSKLVDMAEQADYGYTSFWTR